MRKLHIFPHFRNKGEWHGCKCARKLSELQTLTLNAGTSKGVGNRGNSAAVISYSVS